MTTEGFDLDGYLARIGWAGLLAPDLATLRGVVARHTASIPFEGIEALLGGTPVLDAAGLQAKLVRARRGGWCFEQNSLLKLALEAIGFRPEVLLARVRFGVPPGVTAPRTHMVLRLELPEGPHIADVGFGGMTMTGPIAVRPGESQATPHGAFRLVAQAAAGPPPQTVERLPPQADGRLPPRAAGLLLLQAAIGDEWVDIYLLGLDPQLPADVDAANWLVANRPGGLFTANLVAALSPPGRRLALFNRRLTRRETDGKEVVEMLEGAALGAALERHFGLALEARDLAGVATALQAARPGFVDVTA